VADGQHRDAEGGEPDGDAAQGAEALVQHDHAESHVDQRVDVVAEARLDDMAVITAQT